MGRLCSHASVESVRSTPPDPCAAMPPQLRLSAASLPPLASPRRGPRCPPCASAVVPPCRGSSGAEAGARQVRGGWGSPNATGNSTGSGDGADALDEAEKVRVAKIMVLFLKIHEKEVRKQLWTAKMKMLGNLLILGFCLWTGHLAVKGNGTALLVVALCDKGDKVHKIALAIKAILFG
ncbi:hypothetical protein ZWY2020_036028 [Hordeum vulgare]|nr:hypothetical protein ZWY2020_036028 [Hordeum vulgare]